MELSEDPNLGMEQSSVSAPERLLQFDVTLILGDTGVGQQAGIQSSQLTTTDDAALPQAEGGDHAERPGRFVAGNAVSLKRGGTEGTFHGGHPSACGGVCVLSMGKLSRAQ
ncbi:hypothetical protein AWJ19_24085 [Paenibacillus sp. DMB5]|nr:hypothetical protein AWJ19_24085 [Paenibacillus sp. DMB5]